MRGYRAKLAAMLAVGSLARVAYVLTQPRFDPAWGRPLLDGRYYLDWASSIAAGHGSPSGGAYYLAPLYPYVLAGFLRAFGENFVLLYLAQSGLTLFTAALIAVTARRHAGERAALASAILVLSSHALMFFATRPIGESLGLALVGAALARSGGSKPAQSSFAGALAATAALARPNLLLVPAAWAGLEAVARRWRHAGAIVLGAAAVLAPVAIRNARASGHFVPISSNAGITLYHGNGPGATGGYTLPSGMSGRVETQREEATTLARIRSGLPSLDPVEADRYWGRQAIHERLAHPAGTFRLVGWRGLLLLDDYEHGLDDTPALDANPWRRLAPVSFGWILGLALAGVVLAGFRGTGGGIVWATIAAAAASPIVFYSASRYRLPTAILLCLPAGVGAAALLEAVRRHARGPRTIVAAAAAAGGVLLSLSVPSGGLASSEESGALANRVEALKASGDFAGAERAARAAVARDPGNLLAHYNLGVVLQSSGRPAEASDEYRAVLSLDGVNAAAAGNLAGILISDGRPGEAADLLFTALARGAGNEVCWNNLVVALMATGRVDRARAVYEDAARRGVRVDPAILERLAPAETRN